jgi:hypothetical protein
VMCPQRRTAAQGKKKIGRDQVGALMQ